MFCLVLRDQGFLKKEIVLWKLDNVKKFFYENDNEKSKENRKKLNQIRKQNGG